MASAADDLDLLLSLGDAVPETPPASPSVADGPESNGAFTPPRAAPRPGSTDMSVFRDAVKDYLQAAPESTSPLPQRPKRPKATETLVDKYSGIRIKHLTLSPIEISNRFADIRFVRITAIKNSVGSDRFSGCRATAGVLLDKGVPRVSAKGTSYSIWKMGALEAWTRSMYRCSCSGTRTSTTRALPWARCSLCSTETSAWTMGVKGSLSVLLQWGRC